jgi:hypothetical protein
MDSQESIEEKEQVKIKKPFYLEGSDENFKNVFDLALSSARVYEPIMLKELKHSA